MLNKLVLNPSSIISKIYRRIFEKIDILDSINLMPKPRAICTKTVILRHEKKMCWNTVVCISKSQWRDSWSKWPIFDLVFYNIKLSPCSGPLGSTLPLTGALKWGTVWTSTSTGTGIRKGLSWTFAFC